MRSRIIFFWIMLLLGSLTACDRTAPPSPEPIAQAADTAVLHTPTIIPPTTTSSPTTTPPIEPTHPTTSTPISQPTNTSIPEPTSTHTPTPTPTATPSPGPRQLGYEPVDFASFPIQALWVAPDGRLWVDSESGLWERTTEDVFRQRTRTLDVQILGADGDGRLWALFDGGHTIGVHLSGTDWQRFGPDAGWEPAVDIEFGQGIITDRQGRVWLALGRAGLRRFDPATGQWQTLRAADVGFAPPVSDSDSLVYDGRLAFTDVALDSFGNVWASACAVWLIGDDGPYPFLLHQGQGARWFDGGGWAGSPQIIDRCVQEMAVDENGRVWLIGPQNDLWTGENNFVRFNPDGGVWEFLPVPELSEQFQDRPRFASRIVLDENDSAWLFVSRRGGASFPPDAVYYDSGGSWQLLLEMLPGVIAFGTDETVWAWLEPGYMVIDHPNGLIHYQDGVWQERSFPWVQRVQELVVDGDGRVWFYLEGDPWTLWYDAAS